MTSESRKSVPLASPDFDDALERLRTFLQSQEELTDYDFDGSVMKLLLRVMSHNTHMNAFYLNMVGNEAFLSTAVRRDNVVKRARDLGYTPRSAKAALARVRLDMVPLVLGPNIDIPQFFPFTASDGINNFVFSTTESVSVEQNDFDEYAVDLDLVEGKFLSHRFVVTQEELDNGWTIPNNNVDTAYVYVRVTEADQALPINYDKSTNIYQVNSEDRAFWVFENEAAHHALSFGDGVIGRKLQIGEVVEVTYLVTNQEVANGVGTFQLAAPIAGVSTVVSTIDAAVGGLAIESIESIRFTAPRNFTIQNRAVTSLDYKNLISQFYSNADDVRAWGGQDSDPPEYGKVFISINPRLGTIVSEADKARILEFLSQLKIIGVTPEIVDPEYLYVQPSVRATYSLAKTLLSEADLRLKITNAILDFFEDTVSSFDTTLRHSRLVREIDISENSILNNTTTLSLKKKMIPTIGAIQDKLINFGVPILESSLVSGKFTYLTNTNCFFKAASDGKISIVRANNLGSLITVKQDVGNVDGQTGKVDLQKIQIASIPATPEYIDQATGVKFIPFYATPVNLDITQKFNQIILVEDNRQINVVLTRETS